MCDTMVPVIREHTHAQLFSCLKNGKMESCEQFVRGGDNVAFCITHCVDIDDVVFETNNM